MLSAAFQQRFNAWLDRALAQSIPASVIAFCFNVAEPWSIELVGAERYSDDDADWPCDEAFRPKVKDLDLPESEVGATWQTVFAAAKTLVAAYLERPGPGGDRLRQAVAIAVGFVDGDLQRVWPAVTNAIEPQSG